MLRCSASVVNSGGMALLLSLLIALAGLQSTHCTCTWRKKAIARESFETLSVERFVVKYLRPAIPVVIEGGAATFGDTPWTFDSIADRCSPRAYMPIFKPTGDRWAGLKHVENMPIRQFTQKLERAELDDGRDTGGGEHGERMYGFDLNLMLECPEMLKEIRVPKYFSWCALQRHYVHSPAHSTPFGMEKFTWPSLMAGVPNSRSELHYDEAGLPFWMAVLRGQKLFRMLPYADNLHLARHAGPEENTHYGWPITRPDGAGPGFADYILSEYFSRGAYQFEAVPTGDRNDGPDFDAFPRLCEAVVYEAEVGAGDVIFIPTGAPHAAINQGATIGITSNFFNPFDDVAARTWYERACRMGEWGVPYPEDTCNAMLHVNATHPPPFNEREALTYYEAAGFSGPAEWCRFRRARMMETMSDTELERRSTESRVETFLNFCAAAKEEEDGENRDEL